MITQCYVCKKYLYKGSWLIEEKAHCYSYASGLICNNDISHGLCPECMLLEMQRIEKELNKLVGE